MKTTIYSVITLLAIGSSLYAENMESIENYTLPIAQTIPLDNTLTQADSGVTNINMIDTDGKAYSVKAVGNDIKIEGMEGKVVLLEFFGLNCPACKVLSPNLINLQNKYRDKLQVMAIEVQKHDINPINAYKKEHGINYTTLSNYDVGLMVRYIADKSGWDGAIPFLVAIDSKGEVQFTQAGVMSEEQLEQYIERYSR